MPKAGRHDEGLLRLLVIVSCWLHGQSHPFPSTPNELDSFFGTCLWFAWCNFTGRAPSVVTNVVVMGLSRALPSAVVSVRLLAKSRHLQRLFSVRTGYSVSHLAGEQEFATSPAVPPSVPSGVETPGSLKRTSCRGGHVEAVSQSLSYNPLHVPL